MKNTIAVAGATGNLGFQIVQNLLNAGAEVRAIVRPSSDAAKIQKLETLGARVFAVDFSDERGLTAACAGSDCVVSALAGLEEVILDAQKKLLQAAVEAGVPRFIPSDFSLDFTKLPAGRNRNLDLRRDFHQFLDAVPIAATSIFNGAFADMLTAEMPMILFKQKRIFFWGNADQKMDFTTVADTAAFAAQAALDPKTPRFLRIAGDQVSPRDLQKTASDIFGQPFRFFRPGGLRFFSAVIGLTRFFTPAKGELYPAWQGMQYLRDMLDGRAAMLETDNARYPNFRWTSTRDVLEKHKTAA